MSGPGGVGKDTIVARLLAADPSLRLSRSWTTRARRSDEPENAYEFVDRDTFEERVAAGGFLEWTEYLGHLYGTPLPEVSDGGDVILVIEVDGAGQVLERVPGSVMIFVTPPSQTAQEERLRRRGDSPERIAERLGKGMEESIVGRRLAHHVVVNDDLDRAVAEVAGILHGYRSRPSRKKPDG